MITDRWLSGRYFERRVPIEGKYNPTQASNTKNPAINAAKLVLPIVVDNAIIAVATASITALVVSTRHPRDCSAPKPVEPNKQHAMKQENT